MKTEPLCFNCNHPESDHPLLILTEGTPNLFMDCPTGTIHSRGDEIRIQLAGRSWLYKGFCQEFAGQIQLTLF